MNSEETGIAYLDDRIAEKATYGSELLRNKDGTIKACTSNYMQLLESHPEWVGVLAFDTFAHTVVKAKAPPYKHGKSGKWDDNDDVMTAAWMNRLGVSAQIKNIGPVVQAVAGQSPYHPVIDYLNGLQWDGASRLYTWMNAYLGAEDKQYTQEVGRRFLIGCVARVREPGCKMDNMLILQGPQGALKSTALAKLAGNDWFTDEALIFGNKDSYLTMQGKWIIELAELESLRKSESEQAKHFLSKRADKYRPPYGRNTLEQPRQCVFTGTANPETYLKDPTGNRRYWPVSIANIDLEAIERDRDQLWAEADMMYRAGEPWWIAGNPDYVVEEQEAREEGDPWDTQIMDFLAETTDRYVTVADILAKLGVDARSQTRSMEIRIGHIVTKHAPNWRKDRRCWVPGRPRFWAYEAPKR